MADNNFRSYRGRDAGAPIDAQTDDPLAELARLIGQEPTREPGRAARHQEPALDWPARDRDGARYPAEDRYAAQAGDDAAYDDRYESPVDEFLPEEEGGPQLQSDERGSALSTRLNGARDFARDYYVPPEQSRYREEQQPHAAAGRGLPTFAPDAHVDRYQYDEAVDDDGYALDEEQEEDLPAGRRRSGFFVVAAVLGLAIIGTAGAFAYRAMFGSSMLPSLPPIIKAEEGPNKIIPAKPKSSDQADASNAGSGEKLVSREEQPVDMPAPANPSPRVISTVPIFPDPNSGQAGVPNSAAASAGAQAPMAPPPVAASAPPAQANSIWPPVPAPAATGPGAPAAASPAPVPGAASTAPHKIHTVVIHSDPSGSQSGSMTADAAAPAPLPAPSAEAAPVRMAPVRPAATAPARQAPVARADSNAPLSIVPGQGGGPPPAAAAAPRMRTASTRPAEAPAAPAPRQDSGAMAAGSYAVQVTSQRSEAGAQSEFRALKAKYPSQLGSREPLIRRADLGDKGVYYRALVGPFASAEQATAMCSGLKAAGGSCIVQRN